MSTATARKPRVKPARSIRWLQPPRERFGWGALEITVGKKTDCYLVREIPADFGRGFEIEKDDGTVYHVNLNAERPTCDCKGHEQHSHCKHREGLETLARAGRLPTYRSAGQFAANNPDAYREHENVIVGIFTANPKRCPEPAA